MRGRLFQAVGRWTPVLKNKLVFTRHDHSSLFTTLKYYCSSQSQSTTKEKTVGILAETYVADSWTNVTPRALSKVGRKLHNQQYHPINLVRRRIQSYFYKTFTNRHGNPIFAVFDDISPVVTVKQNFDSLLVPEDHPGRLKSDTYYINSNYLLRAHTTAHDEDMIRMGFDSFIIVGDVYRRDEIDATHYPVFHQLDAVRLFDEHKVFSKVRDPTGLTIFEKTPRMSDKQECHTLEAVKLVEYDLKQALLGMVHCLFGKDVETRWVNVYFPFTHPSWELEVRWKDEWMEVLGCGILEQRILNNAGAHDKVGWAFGIGLERLAMKLYDIPDIRLFWSEDTAFTEQFIVDNPETAIQYKPISLFPPCINHISFWVPESYTPNDFYDLVRSVAGDIVEKVTLEDKFVHPKHNRTSHMYQITYRHMSKTFTQEEVNLIHQHVEEAAEQQLGVEIRRNR